MIFSPGQCQWPIHVVFSWFSLNFEINVHFLTIIINLKLKLKRTTKITMTFGNVYEIRDEEKLSSCNTRLSRILMQPLYYLSNASSSSTHTAKCILCNAANLARGHQLRIVICQRHHRFVIWFQSSILLLKLFPGRSTFIS